MKHNEWSKWELQPGFDAANAYNLLRLHENINRHILTIELVAINTPGHSVKISINAVFACRQVTLAASSDFLMSEFAIDKQHPGAFHQVSNSDFINSLYEGSARFYDAEGFTHLVIVTTTCIIEFAALNFNDEMITVEKVEL